MERKTAAEVKEMFAAAAAKIRGATVSIVFDSAMTALSLPDESVPPDAPSAAAVVRMRHSIYLLNLAARLGHAAAADQLNALASKRGAVSACCVGCGAVRKLKVCGKCRVARFCDTECTKRMWPAHKASCRAWAAERAKSGDAPGA
jgi:hypothetical protein